MVLIVFGLFTVIATALLGLPSGVGLGDGLTLPRRPAGCEPSTFRSISPINTRSGPARDIAALFLFCSYFGTDQSQVQRYLTARIGRRGAALAADERVLENPAAARRAPPRHARVHLLLFTPPPLLFSSADVARLRAGTLLRRMRRSRPIRDRGRRQACHRDRARLRAQVQGRRPSRCREGERQASRGGAQRIHGRAAALVRQNNGVERSPTSTTSPPRSS